MLIKEKGIFLREKVISSISNLIHILSRIRMDQWKQGLPPATRKYKAIALRRSALRDAPSGAERRGGEPLNIWLGALTVPGSADSMQKRLQGGWSKPILALQN